MSYPDRSPSLPVLPSTQRRRAAAVRQATMLAMIQKPLAVRPAAQAPSAGRYSHIGVAALCLTAVALVGTLVTFSILRDQAALSRPGLSIVSPLHP